MSKDFPESPSGSPWARIGTISHDWGTIPPGDSFVFVLAGVSIGTPFFGCPVSTTPQNTLTLCLCASIEGQAALLLQYTNTTGLPIVVGSRDYAVFSLK